jgi:hypothetical protein
MDIGATFCKPRNPRCAECPMQPSCRFAAEASAAPTPEGSTAAAELPTPSRTARRGTVSEPFRSTSRWLRGRIIDRLRDATEGTWVRFDESIGDHDLVAVASALDRLARERLLELRAGSLLEARLPAA